MERFVLGATAVCIGLVTIFRAPHLDTRDKAEQLIESASRIEAPWERYLALRDTDSAAQAFAMNGRDCGFTQTWLGEYVTEPHCDAVQRWWTAQLDALRDALRANDPRAREFVFVQQADEPWLDDLREQHEPGSMALRKEREAVQAREEKEAAAKREAADKQPRIEACAPPAHRTTGPSSMTAAAGSAHASHQQAVCSIQP
jgi:hypothetical protein